MDNNHTISGREDKPKMPGKIELSGIPLKVSVTANDNWDDGTVYP